MLNFESNSTILSISLSKEEKELLKQEAKIYGVSVSAFVRKMIEFYLKEKGKNVSNN